jgi:predicted PurR-regulated permease PerM
MLPLLEKEISLFVTRLPDMIDMTRARLLPELQRMFGASLEWDSAALKKLLAEHWQSAGSVAEKVLPWLTRSGGALIGILVNLLLIPVVLFYLLRDWDFLIERVDHLIPRHWHAKVREVAVEVDHVLAEFLRGQISVMLLMSLYYSLVLWFVSLEFALPIGIIAGILVFVPYLGMVTGLALATLAAAMQFSELGNIVWVWIVFGLGQLIEGMIVTPLLVGKRVGLHPLVVIFALMAFGQLFGFFGILLALPLSAILLVGLRQGQTWYLSSGMYNKP